MATLTATEILSDTLEAFKVAAPMLVSPNGFATDFSSANAERNQQVMAHIRKLPTSSTYDASTGYENGATEANTLVEDVPVTLDQHKHVPIKIDYLNAISDKKDVYQDAINDAAYVLAKEIVDDCLAEALEANFSEQTIETIANTDRDTLGAVRKAMNAKGSGLRRAGIVNGDFFEALETDTRIASGDYYGQQTGGDPIGHLRNVAGFRDIWEYPDLPGNSENLTGFFFESRAMVVATRLPNKSQEVAQSLGIPTQGRFEVVEDEDTGLGLLGIVWQSPGTFDNWMTVALLWGVAAGSQGGSAGDKADYAGHLVASAV